MLYHLGAPKAPTSPCHTKERVSSQGHTSRRPAYIQIKAFDIALYRFPHIQTYICGSKLSRVERCWQACPFSRDHGAVSLLTFHQGELGSIPSQDTLKIFASGNHAGRGLWFVGFLRDPPFLPPLQSGTAPLSPHFTLIGSQDLGTLAQSKLLQTCEPRLYCAPRFAKKPSHQHPSPKIVLSTESSAPSSEGRVSSTTRH
ncbi:hypothetical protein PR048_012126 [Dryococelus australis]|uniref:Uncharacterized protein n=1 Tax=Dryococelus australis TaxID=614101 RepID=A0ABQ9HNP9_9NEOP|nr:hypothetical protein PR048_012126 [Dryococelus australis]